MVVYTKTLPKMVIVLRMGRGHLSASSVTSLSPARPQSFRIIFVGYEDYLHYKIVDITSEKLITRGI